MSTLDRTLKPLGYLEAVLEDVRDVRVDRVVVGGDLLPGPMARETLILLLNLDVPVEWIYGNGEVAVLERMAGSESAKVPEQYRPAMVPIKRRWPRNSAGR